MKYGPLGRSGLIVSRICLGGNSWGAKGHRGWGKFDEVEAPAAKRGAEFGVEHTTDLDAVLARPDVDVVCVCVPSGLHAEVTKPPGTSSVEGKRRASGLSARRVVRSTRQASKGLMRWTLQAVPWSAMSSVVAPTARFGLRAR